MVLDCQTMVVNHVLILVTGHGSERAVEAAKLFVGGDKRLAHGRLVLELGENLELLVLQVVQVVGVAECRVHQLGVHPLAALKPLEIEYTVVPL